MVKLSVWASLPLFPPRESHHFFSFFFFFLTSSPKKGFRSGEPPSPSPFPTLPFFLRFLHHGRGQAFDSFSKTPSPFLPPRKRTKIGLPFFQLPLFTLPSSEFKRKIIFPPLLPLSKLSFPFFSFEKRTKSLFPFLLPPSQKVTPLSLFSASCRF